MSSNSKKTQNAEQSWLQKQRAAIASWYSDGMSWVRSNANRLGVLAIIFVLLYAVIRPPSAIDLSRFSVEQPSPRVVNAPFTFTYEDTLTTERRREQAAQLVAPVYQVNTEVLQRFKQDMQALADASQSLLNDPEAPDNPEAWQEALTQRAGIEIEAQNFEAVPASGPQTVTEALFAYGRDASFWKALLESMHGALGIGIADTTAPLEGGPLNATPNEDAPMPPSLATGVTLMEPDGRERISANQAQIKTFESFLESLLSEFTNRFGEQETPPAAEALVRQLVMSTYAGPSLIYDQSLTQQRRQAAAERINQVMRTVEREETIIGKDEMVSAADLQTLRALQERMSLSILAELGYMVLVAIFIFVIQRYLRSYYEDIYQDLAKIGVIYAAILLILALGRAAEWLEYLDQGTQTLHHIGYAVPTGALGVILTLLVNPRMASFCCAMVSIYLGIQLGNVSAEPAIPYVLVSFMTACGAIYSVSRISRRSDLYQAGGVAIIMAAILIVANFLVQQPNFSALLQDNNALTYSLIWGGLNGILVSILSISLMPLLEEFYGKVTDIRLLELSQKHELIHKLEKEAPGTYQHTMRVATLAETAAEAIGANALLTRVGTYFHDIGKTNKPQFFIENQQKPADKAKHSKKTPQASCNIIRQHVKHGIDLAKEYNLPQAIIDFIPEHHGTTLLAYFYHQALANPNREANINESDYRYPGPKPQSKETAIVMLADSLEASSRLLENPTRREVRQLVRKIINERFMDGQFDECELTMKDLNNLYHSFTESILHTLHQRIHYPGPPLTRAQQAKVEKEEQEEKANSSGNGDTINQQADEPIIAIKDDRKN